jgi:hypothetical protein
MILPEPSKTDPLTFLGILKDIEELFVPMLKFVCEGRVCFNSFSICINDLIISWRNPMEVLLVNHASLLALVKVSVTAVNIKKIHTAIMISISVKPFMLSVRNLSDQLDRRIDDPVAVGVFAAVKDAV